MGIAYWYAATDARTAIAETRPWRGTILTVAELQATRDLQLIDCVLPVDAGAKDPESHNWKLIGEAFSRPVTQNKRDIEYVPTQMLAEAFGRRDLTAFSTRVT